MDLPKIYAFVRVEYQEPSDAVLRGEGSLADAGDPYPLGFLGSVVVMKFRCFWLG